MSLVSEAAEQEVSGRLALVRQRIARACERAGRDPAEVTLVGVAKRQSPERIAAALTLGLTDLGESYAQELARHRELFPLARWHFIGHLQRNKVKAVVPGCVLLHSVDSERLVQALGLRVGELGSGLVQEVLLEVGTGEETKTGVSPEELRKVAAAVQAEPGLKLVGLMGMAPWESTPEEARLVFRELRRLKDALEQDLGRGLPHLSMGMSGDLEPAVEEGATLVRVGEALFGPRTGD